MPQHPFLQALKSIVPPFERVADDASRSSPASASLPELLSLLRRLATAEMRNHLPPDEGLSSMLEDSPQEVSTILRAIKSLVSGYAGDKSRAELLFLAAVLLAIALFVVVIPACEALFGPADDGEDPPLSSSCHSSPAPSCASSCQDEDDDEYWPRRQEGVVELNDLTFLHSRFDSPLGRGGSVGSGTCHSHGSCGMETIEESSEEEDAANPRSMNARLSCAECSAVCEHRSEFLLSDGGPGLLGILEEQDVGAVPGVLRAPGQGVQEAREAQVEPAGLTL